MTVKAVTLKYYAKDSAGNEESVQTQLYNLNLVDPYSSDCNLTSTGMTWNSGGSFGWTGSLIANWAADAVLPHVQIFYSVTYDGTIPADPVTTTFEATYRYTNINRDVYDKTLLSFSSSNGGPVSPTIPSRVHIKWVTRDSIGNLSPVMSRIFNETTLGSLSYI